MTGLSGLCDFDGEVGRSVHGLHKRAETALLREAVDVYLQWNGTDAVAKVEEAAALGALRWEHTEPIAQVGSVGAGGRHT